ncbi:MAG: MBL fold metallo-hydrolase, partial [Bdellovibrionales bacterium]
MGQSVSLTGLHCVCQQVRGLQRTIIFGEVNMNLRFLGGAGTVTGSRYLLEGSHGKVLIDCGLFQGLKALRMKNWEQFPVPAHEISAVFLTHAHLDHSGFLPRLVNEGYKGKIFASHATRDLCRILLMDSAKIQEEEARYANRHAYSKHRPALPLYTTEDVKATLERFVAVEFSKPFECAGFSIEYTHAGHILGASSIQISQAKVRVTFSGD